MIHVLVMRRHPIPVHIHRADSRRAQLGTTERTEGVHDLVAEAPARQ